MSDTIKQAKDAVERLRSALIEECEKFADITAPGEHELTTPHINWTRSTLDDLIAAVRAEAQREAFEWQPMETAPKDGTWVLLVGGESSDEEGGGRVVVGQWSDDLNGHKTDPRWMFAWYDGGYYGEYDAPTHWMPVPPPPAYLKGQP